MLFLRLKDSGSAHLQDETGRERLTPSPGELVGECFAFRSARGGNRRNSQLDAPVCGLLMASLGAVSGFLPTTPFSASLPTSQPRHLCLDLNRTMRNRNLKEEGKRHALQYTGPDHLAWGLSCFRLFIKDLHLIHPLTP